MKNLQPYRVKTISAYHEALGLPKPEHPLISVINLDDFKPPAANEKISVVFDFYIISLKRNVSGAIKYSYGQQSYDFNEGILFFISPGQVFSFEGDEDLKNTGWMLVIHPDYLWHTPLAKTIRHYAYFDYSANEALHLSEKEEATIIDLLKFIEQEYHSNIDTFSQNVIIAQLELLFALAERFYNRQFITRKISNHKILSQLEKVLSDYFNSTALEKKGVPTVQYIAETLKVSPNYLSGLLKSLTGQNTQQHIHNTLIEKAKEKLSTTQLSISEIAYQLGFEHPPSFSKLFKNKTSLSPLAFRSSFN